MPERPGDTSAAGGPGDTSAAGGPGDTSAAGGPGALLSERADPRTNVLVTWVLRVGLVLSFAVLVVGLVVELAAGEHHASAVRMFDLFSPRPLGERIMAVGVLLLTLTPACGVLSVFFGFSRERDRRYVMVAGIVIVVLAAAVSVGFAG